MMLKGRYFIWLLWIISWCSEASGQKIEVTEINIIGGNRTKPSVILRELTFAQHDSLELSTIIETIAENEKRLINTLLFAKVNINLSDLDLDEMKAKFNILIKEINPIIVFPFVDPLNGFNTWWNIYKRSLNKISYGLTLNHINLLRSADVLKLHFQLGFTQKVNINYSFPYLDKNKKIRLGVNGFVSINKDVGYQLMNNKYLFYFDDKNILLKRYKAGIHLNIRPKNYFTFNSFYNYYHYNVDQKITEDLNKNFLNGMHLLGFHELGAEAILDKRDFYVYPLSGYSFSVLLNRLGSWKNDKVNLFLLTLKTSGYHKFSDKWSSAHLGSIRYNLDRDRPPFVLNRGMISDQEEYIRGYEIYNLEGQDYFYVKNNVRYRILDRTMKFGSIMPLSKWRSFPFQIYLTGGYDLGGVKDRFYAYGNRLTNKVLHGAGLGLDFVAFYNRLLRVEWSINHEGTQGIYLHLNTGL